MNKKLLGIIVSPVIKTIRILTLAFFASIFVIQSAHAKDLISIKLDNVPHNLRFPLSKGTNQLLTATIKGGTVTSAWLAKNRESAGRINLTRVDDNEFQINLADPMISAILLSTKENKQFYIFAETADQQVAASIPVQYSTYPPEVQPVTSVAYIKEGNKRTKLKFSYSGSWHNLENIDAFEIEFSPPQAELAATIDIDGTDWKFSKTGEASGILQLKMSPEIKKAWKNFGSLALTTTNSRGDTFKMKAKPELKFDQVPEVITVFQRRSATLPGSNDYFRLYLRDITAGQVLFSLSSEDNVELIKKRSVRQGDYVDFKYEGSEYRISLTSLVNNLFGSDYAVFLYAPKNLNESQKIEFLLQALSHANIRLSKNEQDFSAPIVAANLRKEFKLKENNFKTMEAFLKKLASQKTENKYKVKNIDGSTTELVSWLQNMSSNYIVE